MRTLAIVLVSLAIVQSYAAVDDAPYTMRDFICMVCEQRKVLLENPDNRTALCNEDVSPAICEALYNSTQRFMSTYGEVICDLPCLRYSPELTCAICDNLMQLAVTIGQLPLTDFEKRLQLMCSELEFLDPPCNMIVDEYCPTMHEKAQKENGPENVCQSISLCT
ncbi:hypothetical protein Tcan_10098 [Toxocara canis]|uniref:Saposin B-type domain-containing protein n=2 Tax=Toxocara canis TaxID=6265 RepID=A0A0B2UUK5_TOXCA|nr:hypothetical protein Tcan_10098 [Toxocara canis]VDM43564.1 unnamed protein product [Toxocara canis]